MTSTDTVTKVAARQMKVLDKQGKKPKLFVFDAGHGLDLLDAQQDCQRSDIILRLKGHQVFYQEAVYKGRGRPPKHGARFKLSEAAKTQESQIIRFKKKRLRISSFSGLHARNFPDVLAKLLKLEFLDDKDTPIFAKAIWLFTTATELADETIARAYLWRSSHELSFRFMKQHLALTKNQSPELTNCEHWLELVALAMNILLAIRDELRVQAKPWYPYKGNKPVSQRQAQKQALSFFFKLASITRPTQPAGKAPGRALGFNPAARTRHPVLRKTPKRSKACPTCPFKAAA